MMTCQLTRNVGRASAFLSRCVIATSLTLALYGCGSEEGESAAPPSEVLPIVAMDGFSVAAANQSSYINLASYVRGGQAALTSVRYVGDNHDACPAPTKRGLGFEVNASSGALCDYQFTVSNAQTSDSATMKVFSTQAATPILQPLSHPMVVGGGNATFILPTLLGADWPTGYALDTASVTVKGSDDALGTATAAGNIITYTGPTAAGWNLVVYTLTNAEKPDENLLGSIFIAVSEAVNQPPNITKPKYDYNLENDNATVIMGENISIDLSGFITEPDEQEWQLVGVQSYSATVKPVNENSITNKSLLFRAGTVGDHIVSYVVADHFGGYSVGLIKVTVSPDEQAPTWTGLNAGGGALHCAVALQ